MVAEFILPDDARWFSFLKKTRHDFYHLPEYMIFAEKYEGGKAGAFYVEDRGTALLVPVLTYDLPASLDSEMGGCDLVSAYGYPGPIFSENVGVAQARRLFGTFVDLAKERGVVSVFLRAHPLLDFASGVMAEFGILVKHGRTVYGNLCSDLENIWSGLRKTHKKGIQRLQKLGFVSVCNDFKYWMEYISIYRDTMRRVGAQKFYFFSNDYFNDMKQALGDRLYFWSLLSPDGELASATIYVKTNAIVQAHLGGTAEKFKKYGPHKLLVYDIGNWAKDSGACYLHMGGGVGGKEDSLFEYKTGFFKNYASFYTFRMVVDEQKYHILKTEWISRFGRDVYDEDFFPLYRKPIE